jgi:hypothetical protein
MAYNEFMFEKAMDKVRKVSNEAANWLLDPERPKCMWARHTIDSECKLDHVTNNVTESFNSWLGNVRKKTVLSMVESITCRFVGRFQKKGTKKGVRLTTLSRLKLGRCLTLQCKMEECVE